MNESPYKFETTTAGFMADVVEASASRPVLVDFWAEWCGPCRTLMPMLDRIADDYAGRFALVKVNTDQEPEIAGHFGIRSIPTVILFHGGQPVEQFVGVQPEGTIRALLDKYVGQETDEPAGGREDPVRQVETLIGNRDAAAVRVALDRLAAEAPEHAALPSLRARAAFLDAALEHPDAVALRATLEQDPDDASARHALAAHHALSGDYATALGEWLELMRRNRAFGDDLARRSLLAVFDVLGEDHELTRSYRRRLASLLH